MEASAIAKIVAWSGFGVVVVAWLTASFVAREPLRTRVAWIGATGLYLAIGGLFASLFIRFWNEGNTFVWLAFALLLALFGSGLCLAVVRTVGAFRAGGGRAGGHATH